MPMKLRDGKLYRSGPTSRMLLRDGKVVDAEQSMLVDQFGILYDGSPLVKTPNSGTLGHTPAKERRGGGEAENGMGRKKDLAAGLNMAEINNPVQNEVRTRSSDRRTQEIRSETVEESLKFTMVGSSEECMTQEISKGTTTLNKRYFQKSSGSVTKAIHSIPMTYQSPEQSNVFKTSTPIVQGSSATQTLEREASFSVIGRKTANVTKEEGPKGLIDFEEESFTKVSKRTSNGNDFVTPINRLPVKKSASGERHSSLEDNIFEDLSKPIIYHNVSDDLSDIESLQDQTDYSLAKSRSISYFDSAACRSVNLNHGKWSNFHHWRREWYLNRWKTKSGVRTSKRGWMHKVYTLILSIWSTVHVFITSRISYFISAFDDIWGKEVKPSKGRKSVPFIHRFSRSTSLSTKKQKKSAAANICYNICAPICFGILAFMLIVFLLWPQSIQHDGLDGFSLTKHGMKNAKYITSIMENSASVPAWHVYPVGEKPAVRNQYPVVFYIRNTHTQDGSKRINTFQALSFSGYNVIVPVNPEANLLDGFKGVHKLFIESSIFLWGEVGATRDLQEFAKELCREGFPPAGVVIESEETLDPDRQVKELEVWTCNCNTVTLKDGSPYSYTHVKCPIGIKSVVNCLQALEK